MRFYKRIDNNGDTTTVEAYSHNAKVKGAVEITEAEFDDFKASLPVTEPEPTRDLAAEIDKIKERLNTIERIK